MLISDRRSYKRSSFVRGGDDVGGDDGAAYVRAHARARAIDRRSTKINSHYHIYKTITKLSARR